MMGLYEVDSELTFVIESIIILKIQSVDLVILVLFPLPSIYTPRETLASASTALSNTLYHRRQSPWKPERSSVQLLYEQDKKKRFCDLAHIFTSRSSPLKPPCHQSVSVQILSLWSRAEQHNGDKASSTCCLLDLDGLLCSLWAPKEKNCFL